MRDKVLEFAGFWAINSLILWLASVIFPSLVVFGNANFNPATAVIWTGFILTVVISAVHPLTNQFKIKLAKEYQMGLVYLVVNVLALWILARWLAPITGFGIIRFWVAIVAGIIVNFAQWGFWKFLLAKPVTK